MLVNKISTEQKELKIKAIRFMTTEEFDKYVDQLPQTDGSCWWLEEKTSTRAYYAEGEYRESDMVCSVCSAITPGAVIEATGHTDADSDNKCDVCSESLSTGDSSENETKLLATFTFTSDDTSAEHKDGSDYEGATFTHNDYSLTFTKYSKILQNSQKEHI